MSQAKQLILLALYGAAVNQLPLVRWSTFRFRFLIDSWCEVYYGGDDFSIDVLLLLLSLYIYTLPKFCLLFFLSYDCTLKYHFYTKYFVLSYSMDVASTLSYLILKMLCQRSMLLIRNFR